MPTPELVHETDAVRVGERQHGPHEPGGPREDRAGRRGHDRPLEGQDVRKVREVLSLAPEREVERQRDRLSFDQSLPREGLIALSRRPGQEAVEVDLPVLEGVDQLVREGLPLLIGREPVGEHHHLADRVVVGRGLLEDEIGQEAAEIEVQRNETPGNQRAPLRIEASG